MTTLFDQQKVWEIELYNRREEAREEERAAMLRRLLEKASLPDVSKLTGISQEEIERLTQPRQLPQGPPLIRTEGLYYRKVI